MKVYCLGEKARKQASFTMSVAPAATMKNEEVPADWVDDKNQPIQFNIEFVYGEAEVDDAIARYLLDEKLVKRTKLFLPALDENPLSI
jgi:hypothetical protein